MSSIYQAVRELEETNQPGALCTIIHSSGSTPRHQGSKMLVFEDGKFTGTVGGGEVETRVINEAIDSIKDGKPRRLEYHMVNPKEGDPGVCGGSLEVYVEPILPSPVVVVIGGGHVGKAVAHLAKWLGFRVAVSDDRPEFCTPEANPSADIFYPVAMVDLPHEMRFNSQTYLILTTRGGMVDIEGLPNLLTQKFAYLGIIGSKRRWSLTRKAILEKGVTEEQNGRIHSPIGLELNAETPEEIAVSIMAEIIMLRNDGTGKIMKA
jgi:xanthine dehydrogenase accessory factor